MKRRGLGRGLDVLLPPQTSGEGYRELPVDRLEPNPEQPRTRISPADLEGLAASIGTRGLIEPDRGPGAGRTVPDRRRRAPLAGRPSGGARPGAGGRPRSGRRGPRAPRAGREPAARRPESHRRVARFPAPCRRGRAHPTKKSPRKSAAAAPPFRMPCGCWNWRPKCGSWLPPAVCARRRVERCSLWMSPVSGDSPKRPSAGIFQCAKSSAASRRFGASAPVLAGAPANTWTRTAAMRRNECSVRWDCR